MVIERPFRSVRTLLAALLISGLITQVTAYPTTPSEYMIKAAYMYNFAKFVEWPAPALPSDNFCIGILGDDPFGKTLEDVFSGKTIQDRPIVVRRVNSTAEASRCQMIFISPSEDDHLDRIFSDLSGYPVLTVGETPRFFQQGGIVRFQVLHHNVRFNINLRPAENAQLKISSQLLKVANYVAGAPKAVP